MSKKTMRKMRKALLSLCCAALLVCVTIGATVAYLQDTANVENTFTVGQVHIDLDETDVDEMGEKVSEDRVKENSYKLLPGHEYTKDPTVTVKANSEESYIRLVVTVDNVNMLKSAFPAHVNNGVFLLQDFVDWNAEKWILVSASADGKYVFDYYTTVSNETDSDNKLKPLFTTIEIPETTTNDDLNKINGEVKIEVNAYAVQKDGFDTADAAMTAAFGTAAK